MSLASTTDVSARLGRDLGTAETTAVEFLLDGADAVIADAADIAIADLDATETPLLRFVAVELVCRALANPQGIASLQEQLGQHDSNVRFRDLQDGGGLWLTPNEEALVAKVAGSAQTASPRVGSILTDITGGPSVLDA